MVNVNKGSSFDDFLAEENILSDVTSRAVKRVIADQIIEAMKKIIFQKARWRVECILAEHL